MKNTKRSMIITTVLMVVVLVVAISTSTFAWYTASNRGSASQANLIAANSSAANIAVGWTKSATSTSIEFNANAVTVNPMIPASPLSADMNYANLAFKTTTIDNIGQIGAVTDESTVWEVNNALYNNGSEDVPVDTHHSFFVINHNINSDVTVSMTCTISNDAVTYPNNDKLVIAVFVGGKLKGVFTQLDNYYVGDFVDGTATKFVTGKPASELDKTANLKKTSIDIELEKEVASGTTHYAEITIKAWLDGTALTEEYANKNASFSFDFAEKA